MASSLRGAVEARASRGIGRLRHMPRKSGRSGFVLEIDERTEETASSDDVGVMRASVSAGEPLVQRNRGTRCTCADVAGFCEAAAAARDPGAPSPLRLALVAPNEATAESLERWAEDIERVRRTITIRRVLDGTRVTTVATLASYGFGVATSLAVESVAPSVPGGGTMLRSGVHPKATLRAIDRALANEEKGI